MRMLQLDVIPAFMLRCHFAHDKDITYNSSTSNTFHNTKDFTCNFEIIKSVK